MSELLTYREAGARLQVHEVDALLAELDESNQRKEVK